MFSKISSAHSTNPHQWKAGAQRDGFLWPASKQIFISRRQDSAYFYANRREHALKFKAGSDLVKNYCFKLFLIGGLIVCSVPAASAYQLPSYPGLTSNERAMMLDRYFQRNDSNMSKLLYLVDLLSKANVEIFYKGITYSLAVVVPMVRLFMMRHPSNQPAEDWLRTWCNPKFYIRFPDGSTKPAVQLLIQELQYLS